MKKALMKFGTILLVLSLITLVGCQSGPCLMPTKPAMPGVILNADGGITLPRRETEDLMIYIVELERTINQCVK